MNNARYAWENIVTGYGGSTTKIEKLRAELAGKDATIQLLRQLLSAGSDCRLGRDTRA